MRRWLCILLLFFVPLQFSWAALARYCGQETGVQTQHLGHHAHEHEPHAQAPGEASQGQPAPLGADDCACHCHCHCVAALPLFRALPVWVPPSPAAAGADVSARGPVPSRPERPQWVGHA